MPLQGTAAARFLGETVFKHILIPTDGSPLSERAAMGAAQLASALSARLTAISVSVPFHLFAMGRAKLADTEETYRKNCEKRASGHLDAVRQVAKAAGVFFDAMHVYAEQPYAAIIEAADERDCDAICMASHGHKGLAALVLGSETVQVLTHSTIPVVVWR
ncbi:MAG: universal stress protein [Betaproteobacteria bacterium]